jgi:hypothetical protein
MDFNGMVARLHWKLQKEGEAEMLLPPRLLKVYQPILEQHGLNVIVKPGWNAHNMGFAQALVALIKSIFKFNGPAQSP